MGGIINIAEEAHGYDRSRAVKAVGQIRDTTTLVLERAKAQGITPLAAAEELVAKRLARARDSVDHFIESSAGANHSQPGDSRRSETEPSPAALATPHTTIGVRGHSCECRRARSPKPALTCTFFGGADSRPSRTFGPQTRHLCWSPDLHCAGAQALHCSLSASRYRGPEKPLARIDLRGRRR